VSITGITGPCKMNVALRASPLKRGFFIGNKGGWETENESGCGLVGFGFYEVYMGD